MKPFPTANLAPKMAVRLLQTREKRKELHSAPEIGRLREDGRLLVSWFPSSAADSSLVAYCLPGNLRPQSLLLAKCQDPSLPIPDWSKSLCRRRLLAINGARLADGTTADSWR